MTAHTLAAAGATLATEVAWNGSATDGWISRKLTELGVEVPAADVAAFAVQAGLLKPIPRLGGYTASHKTNAAIFGRKFADFVAGR